MWGSSKAKKYKGKYELANLEFQRGGRVLEKILSMGGGMECDLQRITGYLAEAYIETHKVQFDSTW